MIGVLARFHPWLAALLIGVALGGCLGPPPKEATAPQPVGVAHLLCPDPCRVGIATGPEASREPMLAADPRDPRHMVIAVQEPPVDVSYVTFDGGANWTRVDLPASMGAGPARPASSQRFMSDPVALVLGDGTVLYAALAGDRLPVPSAGGVATVASSGVHLDVARSEDGGRTYPSFTRVASGLGGAAFAYVVPGMVPLGATAEIQDKEWMTQGPDGTVLLVWTHQVGLGGSELLWSTSMDSGRSWTTPRPIERAEVGVFHGSMPAIESDGRWHVTYVATSESTDPYEAWCCPQLMHATSADRGATWQRTLLHPAVPFQMTQLESWPRPEGGDRLFLVYSVGEEDLVQASAGVLREQPLLVWSDDGGATWSKPLALDAMSPHPGSRVPAMDVAEDGTVYATSYVYVEPNRMDRRLVAVRDARVNETLVLDRGLPGPATLPGALGDYMGIAPFPDGSYNVWTAPGAGGRDLFGARATWSMEEGA